MGILQARIREWVAMPSFRGSSQPRDWTQVSCTADRFFTIWATKEAHDKPRQCIKKQRRYFANKGPSSQSYGFSSSHGQMWELDHEESWALTNWCFQIVVLENSLQSPLDCKEIKPVNPKGNQPWIFTGRTDAEAETPVLWLPDAKSWLIGRNTNAGKDWRQKEKGTTEDAMVGWLHWLSEHEFEQTFAYGNSSTKDTEENGAVLEQACCFIRIKSALIWTRFLAWAARWTMLCRKWGRWGEAAYWVGGLSFMLHLRGFIKYSCGNSSQTSVVFRVEGFKPSVQWN